MAEKVTTIRARSRIALVGGDSLLAKEIRELLEEWKPAPRLELISASTENSTTLRAEDDEAIVMVPLTAESLDGSSVAFLAGSAASSRRALKVNPKGGPVLIDLTGSLEDQPAARLRAPSTRAEPPQGDLRAAPIQVVAHRASIAIATVLSAAAKAGVIRRSIIHVFEPASERGKPGLDELQQQTVAVLSFKKLKTDVFDAQLGFNMLARYGEEAVEPLEGVEQQAERHLASLLAGHAAVAGRAIPMPSLRFVQAPVFHGHSFSVWIEFEENPGPRHLSQTLESEGIDVRPEDPPSNVNITGQSGVSVGAISVDANQPKACWLWAVADNLKLASENAIAVAREFLS